MQTNGNLPLIIAHRGASALAPENTSAAFHKAVEAGADGLEFDVRLTKDGVPVVFHDATLRRIAGKNLSLINISSTELQKIDAGSWFNIKYPQYSDQKYSGETIPTLANLLNILSDYKGLLYIELKCKANEIKSLVAAVINVVRRSKLFPNIIIKSFKLEAIAETNRLLPEIRTAALFAPKFMTMLRKQSYLIDKAQECKADELSLHFSLATQKLVERAKVYGLPTIIWTADHPVWVKRSCDIGIRAIITNNPARLLAKRMELFQNNAVFAR